LDEIVGGRLTRRIQNRALQQQNCLYEIGHSYSVITGLVPVIHTLRDAALV